MGRARSDLCLFAPADSPVAAAVVSHFNDCPDSHTQFCFHGTCRFLVQEEKPACVCHSGYVGVRCEHADLLAVVAASQKKQAITALVVVSIVALAVLIVTCVLIQYRWLGKMAIIFQVGAEVLRPSRREVKSCFSLPLPTGTAVMGLAELQPS
ncbi:hypothetical protein ACRRTK_005615 [Alexandromys fortis]